MLVLKLNLPGRATGVHELVAAAEALRGVSDEWDQERRTTLAQTQAVNRHKVAESDERNIELVEALAAALTKAAEKTAAGERATGESVLEIEI